MPEGNPPVVPPPVVPPPVVPPPVVPPPTPPPQTFREAMSRFFTPSLLVHLLLIIFLLLLVYGVQKLSERRAEDKAQEWLCEIDSTIYTNCYETLASVSPSASPSSQNSNTANANSSANTATSAPNPSGTTGANPSGSTNSNSNANDSNTSPAGGGAPGGAGGAAGGTGGATGKGTPTPPFTPPVISLAEGKRLDEQKADISRRIRFHGQVMAFFFYNYYMAIAVLLFTGVLLAISLFFIAQNGWTGTSSYVKTLFVVMAAVSAYYGLFPPVFQQEQNIADNKQLFLEYQTLKHETDSYPVTGTNIKGEVKEAHDFIRYVDSEMARLGNIAIGFDYSKINYKGAFDLNKAQTSNTPAQPSGTPKQPSGSPTTQNK